MTKTGIKIDTIKKGFVVLNVWEHQIGDDGHIITVRNFDISRFYHNRKTNQKGNAKSFREVDLANVVLAVQEAIERYGNNRENDRADYTEEGA